MLASLLNWGLSLIFGGLLVRALAERHELKMDYRAAAAAAYLGLGATWAMGLSSSAAQLQANAASLPKSLLPITGVIPFTETIFLWQSMVITAVLLAISVVIARLVRARTGQRRDRGGDGHRPCDAASRSRLPPPKQPGEWLEYSPLLTILLVAARGRLADPRILAPERDDRDLEPEHLQFPLHHARPAAALAAEAVPQRGRQSRCRPPPAC